jgi:hypothetical protein
LAGKGKKYLGDVLVSLLGNLAIDDVAKMSADAAAERAQHWLPQRVQLNHLFSETSASELHHCRSVFQSALQEVR